MIQRAIRASISPEYGMELIWLWLSVYQQDLLERGNKKKNRIIISTPQDDRAISLL